MLVHVGIFDADSRRIPAFAFPGFRVAGRCTGLRSGLRLDQRGQSFVERLPSLGQDDAILRTLRSSEAWLNRGEVQREQLGVFRFGSFLVVEKPLLAGISLDESDLVGGASGEAEIFQSLFVDGENSAGRPIFRRHVGDSGAIGQRQVAQSRPKILNEFSHDAVLAQHLGHREDEIGCSRAFAQSSSQFHSHHQRNQH